MATTLARLKDGYTNGGRSLGMRLMGSFRSVPISPNQLTVAGLAGNAGAAVLVYRSDYVWAAVALVAASLLDVLDGALARSHGKLTAFGGFLDSTTDRISEGLMLGAIALVLAREGHTVALACVFVALVGSFLVSYTRAKAEALGLSCTVGLMTRTERIVLLAVALLFGGEGSLPYAMELLAALTAFTVWQRISHVHRQLSSPPSEV